MSEKIQSANRRPEESSALEAINIRKSFKSPDGGRIDVLCGAGIKIPRGASVSLRGESGAGKTTFLNIVAALERADSGEIFWDGKRVDKLGNSKQAALRSRMMGFVFQNSCLIPELNAVQNVEFAARIAGIFDSNARRRAVALLESVGLKDRIKHLPQHLSGGERQRVAIARALMNNPRLILADEPTGNLDEKTAEDVMEIFLGLCRDSKTSLLLITHNPDFAERTDLALKLSHGALHQI